MSLGGRVNLGFPCAQLNDSFLSFSKDIYLREELAVDLRYRSSLAFSGITMDGDQFSFAVHQGPARCSLSYHCRSVTREMSCLRESVDSSSSLEALTSR